MPSLNPLACSSRRPAELLATPWATLERPLYVPGPDDNIGLVLHQLRQAVGENFEVGGLEEGSLEDGLDADGEDDGLTWSRGT